MKRILSTIWWAAVAVVCPKAALASMKYECPLCGQRVDRLHTPPCCNYGELCLDCAMHGDYS